MHALASFDDDDDIGLGLQAIDALLNHDSTILDLQDIGRLSSCSRTVATMLDDDNDDGERIWKSIFDRHITAGRKYEYPDTANFRRGRLYATWAGEDNILDCFESPSEEVVAKVRWKVAAECILSKACRCGRMAGYANPLTMMR